MKHTPLHHFHTKHKARFVKFGEYEMPLQYNSSLTEHTAVRNKAGLFDISHMRYVEITGEQAQLAMGYLLSNDISKIQRDGQALYSCILTNQGGVVDDVICYRLSSTTYGLVLNAGCVEKDIRWIKSKLDKYHTSLVLYDEYAMIAAQGPQAIKLVVEQYPQFRAIQQVKKFNAIKCNYNDKQVLIARTGYTGEDGVEIIGDQSIIIEIFTQLKEAGVTLCGLASRDSLRLEAGLNLYGNDMDETISPYECGLGWTVDDSNPSRDFVGREAVSIQKREGFKRFMTGIRMDRKNIPRAGNRIIEGGFVSSGGYSPTLGHGIGFALLPIDLKGRKELHVEVREKPCIAQTCPMKFIKK